MQVTVQEISLKTHEVYNRNSYSNSGLFKVTHVNEPTLQEALVAVSPDAVTYCCNWEDLKIEDNSKTKPEPSPDTFPTPDPSPVENESKLSEKFVLDMLSVTIHKKRL